ncbi:MAG: RIO1 family regulatory kinase/ATPase [Candidatus Methanomethylicia archaeon]
MAVYAAQILKKLTNEDFRILIAIERGMSRYSYTPLNLIVKISGLSLNDTILHLSKIHALKLILRFIGPYIGYRLNYSGYDVLALNVLSKRKIIEAIGGVIAKGKESDIHEALAPGGIKVIAKFFRLGKTSFKQVKCTRSFIGLRRHTSWLYKSRLAALNEFKALEILYKHGLFIPKPIDSNRHVVIMSYINGAPLYTLSKLEDPAKVFEDIIDNLKLALSIGLVHGDLSEYNIMLTPDHSIYIIDWVQWVNVNHPNAHNLLKRDIKNITQYFARKYGIKGDVDKIYGDLRGVMKR